MEKKEADSNNKSILVIEDNKEIQDSLKMALEVEGYYVFTADNGKEGLDKLEKIPTPCMILLDLMMPVMNGWEFVDAISKDLMLSTIPVVVVSAFGDKKGTPKTDGYIQKPIDLDALLNTVTKHCG
ncbi:MAG: response regulator transcription factor [Bacteriovorax sp.]|nr:response regulator transcription factor [Bacteriovorax sp.]